MICATECQIPLYLYRGRFQKSLYCKFHIEIIDCLFELIHQEGAKQVLELLAPDSFSNLVVHGKDVSSISEADVRI